MGRWRSKAAGCLLFLIRNEPVAISRLLGIWVSGNLGLVKTTLEIPDELFRAAKAKAALDGVKLKDLVAEGLRRVVHEPATRTVRRRVRLPLIRSAKPGSLNLTGEDIALAEAQIEAARAR